MSKVTKATKENTTKTENAFKDCVVNGVHYDYVCRVYVNNAKTFGKVTSVPVSLTIDDLITIKGCHYKYTDKNNWIEFPEYKIGDEYKSYFYIAEEMQGDLQMIASAIAPLVITK